VALGGLGEIGRNMTVFEHAGRLLIVDCGVLFPETDQPGIDLILPDFSYIRDRLDDVEAVVLTHGHEDHLGAVPYLLREKSDIPIVGSRFTLALIEAKLREHRITPYTLEVREEQVEQLGPFACEFFAVNHSIPDALAVAIKTDAGIVLHTGDFKMDQLPLDGRLTDLGGVRRLGRDGHRPAAERLDQRRGARVRHAGARDRPVIEGGRAHRRAGHRPCFASPRAPRAAGARRRREARPPRRLRRPLDGAQHGRRP
jgi:mRNA degradation ribonuclease J1/J2